MWEIHFNNHNLSVTYFYIEKNEVFSQLFGKNIKDCYGIL